MLLKIITFDSKIPTWMNDLKCNIYFLRKTEDYLNEILNHKGYIYLSEICEHLCVEWNPDDENVCVRNDRDDRVINFTIYVESNNSFLVHIMTQ